MTRQVVAADVGHIWGKSGKSRLGFALATKRFHNGAIEVWNDMSAGVAVVGTLLLRKIFHKFIEDGNVRVSGAGIPFPTRVVGAVP